MGIIETKNLTKYYGKALGIKDVNLSEIEDIGIDNCRKRKYDKFKIVFKS